MNNSKVVHFSDEFSCDEINKYLIECPDIYYYTRYIPEKNEFHIVKNNNKGNISITPLISQLFKFYENDTNYSKLLTETKVKGNENFAILINTNNNLNEKLKKDLNVLLKR